MELNNKDKIKMSVLGNTMRPSILSSMHFDQCDQSRASDVCGRCDHSCTIKMYSPASEVKPIFNYLNQCSPLPSLVQN